MAKTNKRPATAPDGWEPARRNLGSLLTVAQRAFNIEFHRRMDAVGFADVRPGSGNVFGHIGPHGSTVAVMAQRARMSPQAIVQIVDELERKGYVERLPAPDDRRSKLVRKTRRGEAMTAKAASILQEMEAVHVAAFGHNRFEALREMLRLIGARDDDAAPRTRKVKS